ncbi:unnamed protein product, partial [Didymodactylos carnosus]
ASVLKTKASETVKRLPNTLWHMIYLEIWLKTIIIVLCSTNSSGFNYFSNNNTCQLIDNFTLNYVLQQNLDSEFCFLQPPTALCTNVLDNSLLVAYFSFDSPSPLSYVGSTGLTAIESGQMTVPGHLNEALLFTGSTNSYFQIGNLGVVGTRDQSFSISLWINPTVLTGSTIVHVSLGWEGQGGWCLPFIGFTISGHIAVQMWQGSYAPSVIGPILLLNTWTHVVETFSVANGLKLYINGYLYSATYSISQFFASGSPMFLTVGSAIYASFPACSNLGVLPFTSFAGGVDELRVYSRELIAEDVCTLYYFY